MPPPPHDVIEDPEFRKTGRVKKKQMVSIALFYFRDHKGHKGVKGTLVEVYQGILVHDHDTTYYSYGSGHQDFSMISVCPLPITKPNGF